jgi:isopentenyl-diphosphate delta-isomerase
VRKPRPSSRGAILVFLINDRGEVYLQKRARDVLFYPGHRSASVTGHVSSEETYLEAAKREVKEELGIDCELRPLGKFLTPKWKIRDMMEWEFITVFEGSAINTSSRITLSHETDEGRFLSPNDFRNWVFAEPGKFTPDIAGSEISTPNWGGPDRKDTSPSLSISRSSLEESLTLGVRNQPLNGFLIRSIQASDRVWVASFVDSHWDSNIVIGKGRVLRPAELDGFAAFKGKNPLGLLTYRI